MENIETNYIAVPPEEEKEGSDDFFKIVFGNNETTNIIDVDSDVIKEGVKLIENSVKIERYLIDAIRNFIRKINFFELVESLEGEEISEEEFNQTLEKDSEKYMITLRDFESESDILVISDIMEKIGDDLREFSTSEVSEMFSVKEEQLVTLVELFRNHLIAYGKIH